MLTKRILNRMLNILQYLIELHLISQKYFNKRCLFIAILGLTENDHALSHNSSKSEFNKEKNGFFRFTKRRLITTNTRAHRKDFTKILNTTSVKKKSRISL
jgi:hypothetical protein